MFAVHPQQVKKIKTQVWAFSNFPAIEDELQMGEAKLVRMQDCLLVEIGNASAEISKKWLAMGKIRVDGIHKLSHGEQNIAWQAVDAINEAIEQVKI